MRADREEAEKLPFLKKVIVNDGSREDFIKKAGVFVVFSLYKMKT